MPSSAKNFTKYTLYSNTHNIEKKELSWRGCKRYASKTTKFCTTIIFLDFIGLVTVKKSGYNSHIVAIIPADVQRRAAWRSNADYYTARLGEPL